MAEGNQAAATSSETEIKLTNVAQIPIKSMNNYLIRKQLPIPNHKKIS